MKYVLPAVLWTCLVGSGCQRAAEPVTAESSEAGPSESGTTSAIPVAQAAPADLLDLSLKVEQGDRFPLIKTVEQRLTQLSAAAETSAVTRLQLSLVLTVAETNGNTVLFDVWHTRVHYAHNVDGRQTVYDSSSPADRIPHDALPYAGLVNNGYSVRIGPDHKAEELIGHDEFLLKCLAQVPPDRRQSLMNETAVRFGDEGVAGFIPDTFGILPFSATATPELAARVQRGDSWTIERQLMQPIPVHVKSTCRVVRVSAETAEIDIAGRVTPGQTYSPNRSGSQGMVRVLGGTTQGVCIVDRAFGLPVDVQRRELLNVQVTMPDGSQVTQEKRISTTVRMFPQERGPVVRADEPSSGIIPVSDHGVRGTGVQSIPVTVP